MTYLYEINKGVYKLEDDQFKYLKKLWRENAGRIGNVTSALCDELRREVDGPVQTWMTLFGEVPSTDGIVEICVGRLVALAKGIVVFINFEECFDDEYAGFLARRSRNQLDLRCLGRGIERNFLKNVNEKGYITLKSHNAFVLYPPNDKVNKHLTIPKYRWKIMWEWLNEWLPVSK